jgi:hypothetical protein
MHAPLCCAGRVQLSWARLACDGGSAALRFEILVAELSRAYTAQPLEWRCANRAVGDASTCHADVAAAHGLRARTPLLFRVRARNEFGASLDSEPTSAVRMP